MYKIHLSLIFAGLFLSIQLFAQDTILYNYKAVRVGGGGYVTGIIFSEAAKDVIYARTDIGGAYRWDAVNKLWVPLLNFLGHSAPSFQLSDVESIAPDPLDSNRVYIACGQELGSGSERAIFRSNDKGRTFTQITPPFEMGGNYPGRGNGERLKVDPNVDSILFMGTRTKGLYKSTNFGTSWSSVGNLGIPSGTNNGGINIVLFDKYSSTLGKATPVIYVGISHTGNNIYKSSDGGNTFLPVTGQPNNTLMPHRMSLGPDSMLYISFSNNSGPGGGSSGAVWKYNTIDGTWTNITPKGVSGVGFGGICADKQKHGTIMVTTAGWYPDKIYRSTNSGTTWTEVSTASAKGKIQRNTVDGPWIAWHNGIEGAGGHWLDDVEIDPFNSDRVMYNEGGGLWNCENITKNDKGDTITWKFSVKGLEEMGGWGTGKNIVSPPAGAKLLTVFGDIGGFRHTNFDASPPDKDFFNPVGGSNTSIDVAWNRPNYIVRTNYEATRGSYSSDSGHIWKDFRKCPNIAANNSSNDPGYIAISANGTNIVWSPKGSAMFYSTDSGTNWNYCLGAPVSGCISAADKVNNNKFYTVNQGNGKIYKSTDGGVSWSIAGITSYSYYAMQTVPNNEGNIWLPLGDAGLTFSTDGGDTWTKLNNVQSCEQVGFGMAAPGQLYPVIFTYAKIKNKWGFYRSINKGSSWSRINDDAHSYGWIAGICGDPNKFGRIYISTSGRGALYADQVKDCNGDSLGNAFVDHCGTCVGGNTGKIACADCNGVSNGTAYKDSCGKCVGGTTGKAPCKTDCNGVYNGTAIVDYCGNCVEGNTGQTACIPNFDCSSASTGTQFGIMNGTAYLDSCKKCVGGTTGKKPCMVSYTAQQEFVGIGYSPNPFIGSLNLTTASSSSYQIISLTGGIMESGLCKGSCIVGKGIHQGIYLLRVKNSIDIKTYKIIKE